MEILVLLVVILAAAGILVAAWRGAEAAEREREQRWSQPSGHVPVARSAPRPAAAAEPAAASGGRGGAATGPAPAAAKPRSAPPTQSAQGSPRSQPPTGSPVAGAAAAGQPARASGHAAPAAAPAGRRTTTRTRPPRPEPKPIDVNSAPVGELQKLPGVGIRAAERIVAHRERHGSFTSVKDLEAVEGFDAHRVSRLAPRARV